MSVLLRWSFQPSPVWGVCLVWFLCPSQQFSVMPGWVFLDWTTKQRIKCLVQGHNIVTPLAVRLELATQRSSVYALPTEPLCSVKDKCCVVTSVFRISSANSSCGFGFSFSWNLGYRLFFGNYVRNFSFLSTGVATFRREIGKCESGSQPGHNRTEHVTS